MIKMYSQFEKERNNRIYKEEEKVIESDYLLAHICNTGAFIISGC